ncbi:MAG TPA: hypothetical protein VHY31_28210 [Streptosporangiaceae bacterium]|nr:hypothetical protein [Streptosporangiaceae bacterium]
MSAPASDGTAATGGGSVRGYGSAAAAGLLAAGCVAWSAAPLSGAPHAAGVIVVIAAFCAAASVTSLLVGPASDAMNFDPVTRAAQTAAELLRAVPWAQGVVILALVLEALHRSRPWHTGVLGVALLAFLFAAHLAESRARAAVLRPQAPLIAAGLGLLVLAVGAAALPAQTGRAADVIAVLAALAAVVVAGLALPL